MALKVKKMNENSNRYRRLKRALFGDPTGKIKTFAILSPQNPMAVQSDPSDNKKALEEFKKYLSIGGYSYVPLFGKYGSNERSFIVFNCTIGDAKKMASAYRQESFFFANVNTDGPSTIAYYESDDGKHYKLNDISETVTYETDAEDFFSKFGLKFRINMKAFGDEVPEIKNNGAFEESLNEGKTFMYRARCRRKARGEK